MGGGDSMDRPDRVYSVLLVSSSPKFNTSFEPFITGVLYEPPRIANCISAAKRLLAERTFDLILINSPLTDDPGMRFAIDAAAKSAAAVMVFVKSESYSDLLPGMSAQGVYLLPKQTSSQMIRQAMDWLTTTRERIKRFEKKETTLSEKMAEIRFINRAKWVLITQRGMTEEDAHHYIEKQAMNKCVTKKVIAEEILNASENA